MPSGGARKNAGRKRVRPELPRANKSIATAVLARAKDEEMWLSLLASEDAHLRFKVLEYLTNKRDGRPVQAINHIHDRPIEVEVTTKLSEEIAKARKRAGLK